MSRRPRGYLYDSKKDCSIDIPILLNRGVNLVTKEDVKKSAKLSKIAIDDNELEKYVDDLNDMMRFIDMINNKDFSLESSFDFFDQNNVMPRCDEIYPSLEQDEVFKNVTQKEGDFFELKRKE